MGFAGVYQASLIKYHTDRYLVAYKYLIRSTYLLSTMN